jgi:hypothetical protein
MRGIDDLIRAGKVNYAMISDTPAWWEPKSSCSFGPVLTFLSFRVVSRCNTLAEAYGWSPFVGYQVP